ncbi:contact-dependent growth inhibition system immunity protein [Nocardioides sp.]|uniref:contact-dependent growth inhibition system immunity protein n=1 Tax=Nocardioides sp. TaxID=35761 RepID=UPI00262730D1|nr:contact-dependent growth inhibition system immunity protein [Nocardioides sp.]MCW2738637.1 hypothetical protein [Nocardioides sp.]
MTLQPDDFPALEQFLGAYLHQDWLDEYTSTEMGFRDFLDGEPRHGALIAAELDRVLNSGEDDATLLDLIRDCGSYYLPDAWGLTARAWLTRLLELCTAAPGTVADTDPPA